MVQESLPTFGRASLKNSSPNQDPRKNPYRPLPPRSEPRKHWRSLLASASYTDKSGDWTWFDHPKSAKISQIHGDSQNKNWWFKMDFTHSHWEYHQNARPRGLGQHKLRGWGIQYGSSHYFSRKCWKTIGKSVPIDIGLACPLASVQPWHSMGSSFWDVEEPCQTMIDADIKRAVWKLGYPHIHLIHN